MLGSCSHQSLHSSLHSPLAVRCSGKAYSSLCSRTPSAAGRRLTLVRAEKTAEKETEEKGAGKSAEEITEKYGLEAGLWNIFRSKDAQGRSKGDLAKDLLKRYGSAYLVTSISFAAVSFSLCYALVTAGVDVASLLRRVGLAVSDTNEKVGAVAIAYAAHKALSPVRFPPTVALTPIVAKFLGKDKQKDGNGSKP